ncbi:hypothetical protein OH76DRAFT_1488170 [Lentinus brumalis]|uniref:Uncharacterized protein n=1 Tax=Lentinus brumalis TaxID=2498619 RepID=A0A371CS02_9APHY|nr:hypothetical protein OH76DRAFT_1488170 [Polyporus brumalis]
MGRGAKYYTLEEKKAAKREQAKAYRNSAKGKETKAEANRRQYQQRQAGTTTASQPAGAPVTAGGTVLAESSNAPYTRWESPGIPLIPLFDTFVPGALVPARGDIAPLLELPDDLIVRAEKVLHASFGLVLGSGPLLGLWAPPYRFVAAEEDVMDRPLVRADGARPQRAAILGAFQCRQVLVAARDRRGRWRHTCEDELEVEVHCEIAARVDAWRALRDSIPEDTGSEDEELALDWGAKIVHMLAEEWEWRQRGLEAYTRMLGSSKMPWQCMFAEIMAFTGHDVE